MDLHVRWHKPVALKEIRAGSNTPLIYDIDLDRIPEEPGVYVFIRKYGTNQNPLYVGKAKNLKSRIKQHLTNNVRLLKRIQNKESGSRAVAFGVFDPKPGQQAEKCISLIERALIRHFLSGGHNLLNISGTHIGKHLLSSVKVSGGFVPRKIYFE
jgi:hypothetical protein